jgi:hypothetical protein
MPPSDNENLYHDALKGFLYKEAVEELRVGKIQIYGHQEAADAIDAWVEEQFFKRLNEHQNRGF